MSKEALGGLVLSLKENESLIVNIPGGREIIVKLCNVTTGSNGGRRKAMLRVVAPREFSISRKEHP